MKSIWGKVTLIILGSLAFIYLLMVVVAAFVFMPGTTINGVPVSFESINGANHKLQIKDMNYSLTLKFRDSEKTIIASDASVDSNYFSEIKSLKEKQNPFLWFMQFGTSLYVEPKVDLSLHSVEKKLSLFSELDMEGKKSPENCSIDFVGDVVVASDGDAGNVIDEDGKKKLATVVVDAIKNHKQVVDVRNEDIYQKAKYRADSKEVQAFLAYCNSVVGLKITYTVGEAEIKIQPEELYSVLTINTKEYRAYVNYHLVEQLVAKYAKRLNTVETKRKFTTHDGKEIMVTGPYYGWLLDEETEAKTLYEEIKSLNNVRREPIFLQKAYTYYDNMDDIGNFYAEVDLKQQHMYLYKDGECLLDSDCVTGCVGAGHSTPTGLYSVKYMESPSVLVGEDYESKVTFWMPFNGGIGFHDATWRGSFGGEIYQYNGSHGCVNLPWSAAESLYYKIEPGLPVVVH